MLVSKSFIVTGETIHRNGQAEKNIAQKVDTVINAFLSQAGARYIDLKTDVKVTPGVGTDVAFVTVILDIEPKKDFEPIPEKGEVRAVKRPSK